MQKLSRRLAALARHIPAGSVVADVGADHAALVIALVASGRCPRGIATELRHAPAAVARSRVAAAGLAGRISVRLGNGLEPLQPGEVDVVIIAGLGGVTIANILADAPAVTRAVRRLVLQPMVASETVRRRLDGLEFGLADEDLVSEAGRWYEILVAEPSGRGGAGPLAPVGVAVRRVAGRLDVPEDAVWECGPVLALRRPPGFDAWIRGKIAGYDRILEEMAGAARTADADRFRLRRDGLRDLLNADRPVRRITPD